MIRSSMIKAGVAVTASAAVIAGGALVGEGTDTAQLSPTWEATQQHDADNQAASNASAVAAETQRKAEAKARKMAAARKRALADRKAEAKAKEKAAARKRAQAERRAKAAEAARAARGGTPTQNRALGRRMCADRGWSSSQCADLVKLWNRESGWSTRAHNSNSGAHGIPQSLPGSKMASHGSDWATSARTQIAWGLDYIADAYGNPSNAWSHSQRNGWY